MKVLIIRSGDFPMGSAPAFRTLNIAKLLSSCGNDVLVLASRINIAKEDQYKFGKDFVSVKCFHPSDDGQNYFELLQSILVKEQPDVALLPSSIYGYKPSVRLLHKMSIPIVLDSVEWYNASNWRLGYADPRYYKFCFLWRTAFPKADGIIAISRLIQAYYSKKSNNVVRIPTITDCADTPFRTSVDSDKIRFVFAGQLDKGKDNIDTFIEALAIVDPTGERTQLDIYGPNLEDVRKHLGKKSGLLTDHINIIIHGRVPQSQAQDACLHSDFSVFFRLNRRSANAGFPTKLGECMTFGTPAICNDTGDISLVVQDRKNGYLLKTKSVEEITETLRHILSLSVEQRVQMRTEARKSAETFFDYHNYREQIQEVLAAAVRGEK